MDIVRRTVPTAAAALAAAGVHPVLARVFASRGVATAGRARRRSRDAAAVRDDEGHRRAPRRASPMRYATARRS